MPYVVRQLVETLLTPVTADPGEPLQSALDRMLERQFSQLPVVKGDQHYFITQESILSALHGFGMTPSDKGLRVEDALVKVHRVFFEEDSLFELLRGMGESNAAIVLDQEGLKCVVTTYDTTQFFRQWSEDILHARDIEMGLKKIVNAAFKNPDGQIDEAMRSDAIAEIVPSNKDLRRKFNRALSSYLTARLGAGVKIPDDRLNSAFGQFVRDIAGIGHLDPGTKLYEDFCTAMASCFSGLEKQLGDVEAKIADDAFLELYNRNEEIRSFDHLTLHQYVQLFLSKHCWDKCSEVFGVGKLPVETLLNGVRETRNKLAHFQEEDITAQQRYQLRTCSEWLGDRIKPAIAVIEAAAAIQRDMSRPAEAAGSTLSS